MIKQIEKAINDLGIICNPVDHVSIYDIAKIINYLNKQNNE